MQKYNKIWKSWSYNVFFYSSFLYYDNCLSIFTFISFCNNDERRTNITKNDEKIDIGIIFYFLYCYNINNGIKYLADS